MANVVQILIRAKDRSGNALKGFNVSLAGLAKGAAVAGAALTAMGVAATVAFARMVKQAADVADETRKAAQALGTTTERLSQLRFAAEQSGLANEQLAVGLGQLSKNLLDFRTGTGEAVDAFIELGISATDANGEMRDSGEVLVEIAERFSKMEDSGLKTALAMRVFGRSGRDMIPLLNQGAAGIDKLRRQADRLGLTIDEDTAVASERLNDSLNVLLRSFDGFKQQLGSEVIPQLADMTEEVSNAVTEYQLVETAVMATKDAFMALSPVLTATLEKIGAISNAYADFRPLLNRVITDLVKVGVRGAAGVPDEGSIRFTGKPQTGEGAPLGRLVQSMMGGAEQSEEPRGLSVRSFFSDEALTHLKDRAQETLLPTIDEIMAEIASRDAMMLENAQALEDARKRIAEQGAKNRIDLASREYQAILGLSGQMFGQLAALAEQGGKKNFALVQGLRIGEAVMHTAAGVSRALAEHPWPLSSVIAGLVSAIGATQIALIAQQKPSFAIGTGFVPHDMEANIHRGERIVPSTDNQDLTEFLDRATTSQQTRIVLEIDGREIGEAIGDLSRNGRLTLSPRAIA